MHAYIKKNQKKLMAVFGVCLMVAFLLPTVGQNAGGGDAVYGELDGKKVHLSEIQQARRDWDVARRISVKEFYGPRSLVSRILGDEAASEISARPEMYYLLLKEAEMMGVTVTNDEVETTLRSKSLTIPAKNMEEMDEYRAALSRLILVTKAFGRVCNNIKVSEPLSNRWLGENMQEMKVTLVELPAENYLKDVPAPTTQQVADQFKRFSNVEAGSQFTRDNPLGFGYKYPNRVKLQYIQISAADLKKSLRPGPDKMEQFNDLLVEAWRYFQAHKDEFPAPSATTQPTTQPVAMEDKLRFALVQDKVIDRVLEPRAQKLAGDILSKLTSQFGKDWSTYSKNAKANPPTTQPSSIGVPYASFEYFQKTAEEIQKQYGVLPRIVDINTYQSLKDLQKLEHISDAAEGQMPFWFLAGISPAAFFPADQRKPEQMEVLQPSGLLQSEGDYFVFRLTDAKAAEVPKDVSEVADKVAEDLKLEAAMKSAHQAAQALADVGATSTLAEVAWKGDKKPVMTDYFGARTPKIDAFPLEGNNQSEFIRKCFQSLGTQVRGNKTRPTAVIDLPQKKSVVAVQLNDIKPLWNEETKAYSRLAAETGIAGELAQQFQREWYNYAALIQRMKYKPAQKEA